MAHGTNYKLYRSVDREECQKKCGQESEISCKSINYDKTKSDCYLIDVSPEQARNELKFRIGDNFTQYDLMVCEGEYY